MENRHPHKKINNEVLPQLLCHPHCPLYLSCLVVFAYKMVLTLEVSFLLCKEVWYYLETTQKNGIQLQKKKYN